MTVFMWPIPLPPSCLPQASIHGFGDQRGEPVSRGNPRGAPGMAVEGCVADLSLARHPRHFTSPKNALNLATARGTVMTFEPKSEFLHTLLTRGYIHQCSDFAGLDQKAAAGELVAYIGFDCTAPSLHVGSLVQIMMLRWLQKTGNKPVSLMGGGTTRVGDPSGKDESRKILTLDDIEANKTGIKAVFSKFLSFGEGNTDAVMPDNAEWLAKLNYIDFLRDVGRHFSVNRMMSMDSVRMRLERDQELSFLEFNYMCLQSYDFVELNRRYGCIAQFGGSDQWGNIVSGIDLGRRMGTPQLYALTTPLLTTASGAKMGKTAAGAIWLNADMLSPWDYWQFWRNTEDRDVGRFLKLFTELPLDEIARLEALGGAEINEAKKILATEATAMLHGRATAEEARETARKTFEEGVAAATLPSISVPQAELESGVAVLSIFVTAGLVASNSEARRQIKGGGLRINDVAVTDERAMITPDDLNAGAIKLSLGKKRHVLLTVA
jgi:tyrosyl-tRNA synthetase